MYHQDTSYYQRKALQKVVKRNEMAAKIHDLKTKFEGEKIVKTKPVGNIDFGGLR